jgi:shikimate dehydrogenase
MSETAESSVRAVHTKEVRVGLIGSGIQKSSSPALHMDEARAQGFPLTYKLFDLDHSAGGAQGLVQLLDDAERADYAGLNITHPCKQLVMQHVDELSEHAQALGAVNTVVFSQGRRFGHNTDWSGFAEGFRRELPNVPLHEVTQLGSGGAGSAVAYAMLRMGTQQIRLFDIDHDKAERLAGALSALFGAGRALAVTDLEASLHQSCGLVNTTPMGMDRYPGMPLPSHLLRASLWVAEIVYFPLETELLRCARALGCLTVDGGGMVVFQAADAFRLFTGFQADADRMLARFRSRLLTGSEVVDD